MIGGVFFFRVRENVRRRKKTDVILFIKKVSNTVILPIVFNIVILSVNKSFLRILFFFFLHV